MNILFFLRPKSGVTYLSIGNSLRQGLERMRASGYTEIPVVDKDGNYVGTVSQGDFLWRILDESFTDMQMAEQEKIDPLVSSRITPVKINTSMEDLLSKAAPGTRMPMVKTLGELYTVRGMKNVNKRLDRLKGSPGIIIFYTEGCEVCAAEKKAAMELLVDRKTKVLMINVDKIMSSDPSLASCLMDLFDLSSLPYILKTDKNGTILRRYLSLTF